MLYRYLIRPNPGSEYSDVVIQTSELLTMITSFLKEQPEGAQPVSSRDIGRFLQGQVMDGRDALTQLKQQHNGLRSFFYEFQVGKKQADSSSTPFTPLPHSLPHHLPSFMSSSRSLRCPSLRRRRRRMARLSSSSS